MIAFALPSHLLAHEAHSPAQPAAAVDEAPFLKENDAAMTKMMNDMAIKPSGDIDRDFVAMMSPHHQGAIDMAISELRHGKNEQLRRIAQEIIVDGARRAVLPRCPDQPSRPRLRGRAILEHGLGDGSRQ
jgi:hypothetical protein